MPFPDFILNLPGIDVPFPEHVVHTSAIRSDAGLVAFFFFFFFKTDMILPMHSHGA